MNTATATTASASTVLASPATAAAARDTSNVSDCGLFWQRTEVTTVATASLAMLRQGTQVTTVALASVTREDVASLARMRMRQETLVSCGFVLSGY